jgi:hypothetical protein
MSITVKKVNSVTSVISFEPDDQSESEYILFINFN